jgi:RNA polymerase sigma-70 factor (ECF subfamily)
MSGTKSNSVPEMDRERERDLLRRCRRGESDAYEPIVRHHEQKVFGLLYALTGSVEDARDLTQDTFIRAWRRINQYDPERPFAPWALMIARNLHHDQYRRTKKTLSVESMTEEGSLILSDEHADTERHAISEETRSRIWTALNRLDEAKREPLVLKDISELSYEELSWMMGIPRGTVASRVFHARQALRRLLPDQDNSVSRRGFSYDVTCS